MGPEPYEGATRVQQEHPQFFRHVLTVPEMEDEAPVTDAERQRFADVDAGSRLKADSDADPDDEAVRDEVSEVGIIVKYALMPSWKGGFLGGDGDVQRVSIDVDVVDATVV